MEAKLHQELIGTRISVSSSSSSLLSSEVDSPSTLEASSMQNDTDDAIFQGTIEKANFLETVINKTNDSSWPRDRDVTQKSDFVKRLSRDTTTGSDEWNTRSTSSMKYWIKNATIERNARQTGRTRLKKLINFYTSHRNKRQFNVELRRGSTDLWDDDHVIGVSSDQQQQPLHLPPSVRTHGSSRKKKRTVEIGGKVNSVASFRGQLRWRQLNPRPQVTARSRRKRQDHQRKKLALNMQGKKKDNKTSRLFTHTGLLEKNETQLFVQRRGKIVLKSLTFPTQKLQLWKNLLMTAWDISPPVVSQLLDHFPTRKSLRRAARRIQFQNPYTSLICILVAPHLNLHLLDLTFTPNGISAIGKRSTESRLREIASVSRPKSMSCFRCGTKEPPSDIRKRSHQHNHLIHFPWFYLPIIPIASVLPLLHRNHERNVLARRFALRVLEFHSADVPKLYSLELIQSLRADSGRVVESVLIDLAKAYPSFYHQLCFLLSSELVVGILSFYFCVVIIVRWVLLLLYFMFLSDLPTFHILYWFCLSTFCSQSRN